MKQCRGREEQIGEYARAEAVQVHQRDAHQLIAGAAENAGVLAALPEVLLRYNESMSRSYRADEKVFQKLRAAGKTSWDEQADPEANFDKFVMRPFLEESLAGMPPVSHGLSALEIGCGSGPICCFPAARAWAVRGIDVSQTALEMARQNAAQRGLNVQFDAADICSMYPSSRTVTISLSTAIVCTALCVTNIGARR